MQVRSPGHVIRCDPRPRHPGDHGSGEPPGERSGPCPALPSLATPGFRLYRRPQRATWTEGRRSRLKAGLASVGGVLAIFAHPCNNINPWVHSQPQQMPLRSWTFSNLNASADAR